MTFEEIKLKLAATLGATKILKEEITGLQPALFIASEDLLTVCSFLRDTEGLYFDFLSNITAVDYEDHFTIVYHLSSLPYQHTLVLKVELETNRSLDDL